MTFEKAFMDWWREYSVTLQDTTSKQKEYMFTAHILPAFGGMELEQITRDHIQSFVLDKGKHLSAGTVKCLYKILNPFFSAAVASGLITSTPVVKITLPKAPAKEVEVYTPEEVQALIQAATPQWFADIILMAYRTGMRRGEVHALKWSDINFATNTALVRRSAETVRRGDFIVHQTKTKSSIRSVLLDSSVLEMLRRRKETAETEWVFQTRNTRPVSPSYDSHLLHLACEKAGIPYRNFHTFRHSHATFLLEKGVNPKIVQERLGHSDISITLGTYGHIVPGMQREALHALESID